MMPTPTSTRGSPETPSPAGDGNDQSHYQYQYQYEYDYDQYDDEQQQQQQQLQSENASVGNGRLLLAEMAAQAAKACTQIVSDNCNICTVYCDRQVQYESVLEPYTTAAASSTGPALLSHLFHELDHYYNDDHGAPEGTDDSSSSIGNTDRSHIQAYREQLFDEESVVQQVSSRHFDEDDDDEQNDDGYQVIGSRE